jgi:hypothetical protein
VALLRTSRQDEAQLKITRQLLEPLEWAGFAYQAVVLVQTAVIDPFPAASQTAIIALGVLHAAAAVHAFRSRGPLARGGPWIVGWAAAALAVPAAVALLTPSGQFGYNASCVQACTYPAPPLLFVALYPWLSGLLARRAAIEIGFLAALAADWVAMVYVVDPRPGSKQLEAVGSSLLWCLVGFGIGKVIGRLSGVMQRNEAAVHQQKNNEFFDFLHSHIKAGITAVKYEQPNVGAMLEKLAEMERLVSEERLRTLLSLERVPLAVLCSERIRAFTGIVTIAESPRSGVRTVLNAVGRLLDWSLGDLLTNAAKHGAKTVWIRLAPSDAGLELIVEDDGPGFSADVLDDQSTMLHRLREEARRLGGDLRREPREPHGSRMILAVPEAGPRPRKRAP